MTYHSSERQSQRVIASVYSEELTFEEFANWFDINRFWVFDICINQTVMRTFNASVNERLHVVENWDYWGSTCRPYDKRQQCIYIGMGICRMKIKQSQRQAFKDPVVESQGGYWVREVAAVLVTCGEIFPWFLRWRTGVIKPWQVMWRVRVPRSW